MTNNKQQTAVEWLEIELEKLWVEKYLSPITIKPLIEQAKEMEKKQHLKTWGNGWVNGDISVDNYESVVENYYNETYGGNK
jgi:hypothetical protein